MCTGGHPIQNHIIREVEGCTTYQVLFPENSFLSPGVTIYLSTRLRHLNEDAQPFHLLTTMEADSPTLKAGISHCGQYSTIINKYLNIKKYVLQETMDHQQLSWLIWEMRYTPYHGRTLQLLFTNTFVADSRNAIKKRWKDFSLFIYI